MKIKIMYYIANLEVGGAERVTVNLIRQMDRDKFDIYLVLVDKRGDFLDLIPNYVNIVDLGVKKTLFSIFKLRKEIKRIEPDIVYSTLFRTHIAVDLALSFYNKRKPKIVLRSPSSPKLLIERGEHSWIMRKFIEKAYRASDIILAQTPDMKEEIVSYHKIKEDKIKVFINPLDTKLIDKKISNSINPFDENKVNIVAAGRLSYVKGFDTLIYAFKEVVKKNDNFFLNIIGRDGGEKNNLELLIEKLNIKDKVKLWGFQENPYKFFYYSQLYVLSSRREGLPNTVLENLYLKKPVIATRCVPFIEKLINDKYNGYIIDVEDVEALTKSILEYDKLDVEESNIIDNLSTIDELFLTLI